MTIQANSQVQIGAPTLLTMGPEKVLKADMNFGELAFGLDAPHLSDEEADKFMDALFWVIVTFAEIGLGGHPMKQVQTKEEIRENLSFMAEQIFLSVS